MRMLVLVGCASLSLHATDSSNGNAGDGLVIWKEGHCEVVDADRLQKAFEDYLAQPAVPESEARSRSGKLQEAITLLGPGIPTPDDLGKAYRLVQQLAGDPLDQGRCGELLNAIRKISEVLTRQKTPPANEAALRRQQEILSWNIVVGKKYEELVNTPSLRSHGKTSPKPSPANADEQRLSEVMSEIRRMELGGEVTELQVRLELQDIALRLLTRGDYLESILAVRFYRGLFDDRKVPLRLDPEAKLQISAADSTPNLGILETIATQTLGNITRKLADTTALIQCGSLVDASKDLTAAFAQGSRTVEVRSYPGEAKEKILLQIRAERKLNEFMDNKDYESAQEALTTIEGQATDFQGKDYRSAIESGKSLSAIHLAAARKGGLEGKNDEMLKELKQATDFWPKNPGILSVVSEFQGSASIQRAVIEEYDVLYAAHKVKEIARGKERFEAALASLPTRHSEFVGALAEGQAIDEGMKRARELRDFGSPVSAWELTEILCRRYPEQDDPKRLRATLRSGIEPLADGVGEASSLEGAQPASALARYLRLQRLYPRSELVSEGVARLSRRLLIPPSPAGQ